MPSTYRAKNLIAWAATNFPNPGPAANMSEYESAITNPLKAKKTLTTR